VWVYHRAGTSQFAYVFFSMHFRKCVAFVVREYAAIRCNIPDPRDVTEEDINTLITALNRCYAEMVAVIYIALCGVEPSTTKARLTVVEWLRKPDTMYRVRR